VAECRRLLAERAEQFAGSPFVLLWNGFHALWCGVVVVLIAAGVIFVGFGIVTVCRGDEAVTVNGQAVRGVEGVLVLAGFLAVGVLVGAVMVALGRRLRFTPGRLPHVDCAYEFRLPDGEVVRSRDSVPFSALADAEAPFPVLYNRKNPKE